MFLYSAALQRLLPPPLPKEKVFGFFSSAKSLSELGHGKKYAFGAGI